MDFLSGITGAVAGVFQWFFDLITGIFNGTFGTFFGFFG